jgi:sphinganine-1-phosphate aldolase
VTNPEIIVPSTAHAAFHKAASYFNIKIHVVACPAPSYRVSVPRVRRLINPNTIMLVGSAPNYPHGIVDDIPALSRLALSFNGGIPLHVDCCLGSFLLPFLSSAGFPAPFAESGGFDFKVPGVTSISIDTHKYGFAPKGNSVILYRNKQLRQSQYFICPDWSGGVYGSPSMAGSRPGALIAGCWASMMSVGEAGYIDSCHKIVGTRITIQNAINEHETLKSSLRVLGEPSVSVVAFESKDPDVDVYDLSDGMSSRGWHLNALQDPPGIHVAVTLPMTKGEAVEELINDLVESVKVEKEKAEEMRRNGAGLQGEKKRGNAGALYGVAGKIPDKSVVERLVVGFLDTLYKA